MHCDARERKVDKLLSPFHPPPPFNTGVTIEMAKAIITVEDTEDGTVTIGLEFDPPGQAEDEATPAQYAALQMLNIAKELEES